MRGFLRAILLFWLMLAVSPAFAHASLLSSVPPADALLSAIPATVSLTFNEPISPVALSLVSPNGAVENLEGAADGGRLIVRLPAAVGQGSYLLCWRVVSADGHPVAGAMPLTTEASGGLRAATAEPNDGVRPAIWIVTTLMYLGLFFGVGGTLFLALVATNRPVGRVCWSLLALGAVMIAISVPLHGLDLTGRTLAAVLDPAVLAAAIQTSYGALAGLALLAICLAGVAAALRRKWRLVLALLSLATMGAAMSASGHVATADPSAVARVALVVHVVGFAVWIGALPWLAFELVLRPANASRGLAVFSRMIPVPAGAVLVSGAVLAIIQLGWPSAAWIGPYGALLATKLVLVAVLFALAAWNRWKLTSPALAGEIRAQTALRRFVLVEVVIVLAVLGLAAGWRFTPPPRAVPAEQRVELATHLHGSGMMAELSISDPRRGGLATVQLTPMEAQIEEARSVTLSLGVADLAPIKLEAVGQGQGKWIAKVPPLPITGKWKVKLEVRVSDFELVSLPGTIVVK